LIEIKDNLGLSPRFYEKPIAENKYISSVGKLQFFDTQPKMSIIYNTEIKINYSTIINSHF
jgi:hypothetical protein